MGNIITCIANDYSIAPCNYEYIVVETLFHLGMTWTCGKGYYYIDGKFTNASSESTSVEYIKTWEFHVQKQITVVHQQEIVSFQPPRLPLAPIKRVLTIFRLHPVFLSRFYRFGYLLEPANVRVSALNIQLFIGCCNYWQTMSSVKNKYTEAIPSELTLSYCSINRT